MQRAIAKIIRNFVLEHDMKKRLSDLWYYFKKEMRGFNWTLYVSSFAAVAVVVIAMAYLISPICFAILLVFLYPVPYCLYQAYQRCKPIEGPNDGPILYSVD